MNRVDSFDFSSLSQEEFMELATQALRGIESPGKGISRELFLAAIQIFPMTCVECLVVDNIEKPLMILLTWREDEHYQAWHFPGSYVRFGESFEDAVRRTVQEELNAGLRRLKDTGLKFAGVDNRGHSISLVFLVELDSESKDGKWFTPASLPDNLLDCHKKFLAAALGWK